MVFPKHTTVDDDGTIFAYHGNPVSQLLATHKNVILISGSQNVTFSNCRFSNNQMTPIVAQNSKIYFSGSLTFLNNTGLIGGAIGVI